MMNSNIKIVALPVCGWMQLLLSRVFQSHRRSFAALLGGLLFLCVMLSMTAVNVAAAEPTGETAPADAELIAPAAIDELRELYVGPNEPMTDSAKVRRYELILAKARNLAAAQPDALNLHELREVMMQAAQGQAVVTGTAESREALMNLARQIVASEAPAEMRMRADLLLTHAEVARQGPRSEKAAAAIAAFADRYYETEVEAESAMRAMMMAFEIGHKTIFDALEDRLIRDFGDNPRVVAFLRDRFGKRIDGKVVNALLQRSDGEGFWRLPMDTLGRPVTVVFWSAAVEHLELKMRHVKQVYREHPEDVFLLGVNLDDAGQMARDAAERLGLDFPQVYRGLGASDPLFMLFADKTIPSISYIRPDGLSAAVVEERGRDDLGWSAPRDNEPISLALTYLRSGEFLITRPVGPTDLTAPPEVGPPETARAAMSALAGTRLPAETLESIQECFHVPPRRYNLGEPITGRYDRPDREPIAALYEKAIERCEQALRDHEDAGDLFLVRNRLMVALVGLSAIRTDPTLLRRAADVGRAVLDSDQVPADAKLLADTCVLRWELRQTMDTAQIRDELRALVARYEDGPRKPHALAMAAILAMELGERGLHGDFVHMIEENHRLNQDMRAFLWCMEDDREVGRELRAEVPLLDGGTLRLPEDWRGQPGVVIFIAYSDDPEVMRKRCEHMQALQLDQRWYQRTDSPDGLRVLYAIIGGTHRQVQDLVEEYDWPWPVAYSGSGWDDPLAQAYRGPGPQHGYSMLVVDPSGTIIDDKRGLWMNRGFERTLEKLSQIRKDAQARQTGNHALAEGDFETAAAEFQSIVDRAGHNRPSPLTCMQLARARAGLGQWEQAVTWIDHAHRFAVEGEADAELRSRIETLQTEYKRELARIDPKRDTAAFVPPDDIDEVMPGSRIIPRWSVVGPFPRRQAEMTNRYQSLVTDTQSGQAKAWAEPLEPELNPDPNATYEDKFGGEARWAEVRVDDYGFLSLDDVYRQDLAVACARSYIYSPEGGEYPVGIGSDDHHVVRVNGQIVHQHFGGRPAELAQDRFKMRLEPGWNEILVKCGDDFGGWGFYFQIVDPQESLRFTTELPDDATVKPMHSGSESLHQ
jgi:tetratricopeptide (TPR) repeat protein